MVHLSLFFPSQIHSFPFLPIRIGLGWNTKKSVLIIKVLSLPKSFTLETCLWTKGAKRAKKKERDVHKTPIQIQSTIFVLLDLYLIWFGVLGTSYMQLLPKSLCIHCCAIEYRQTEKHRKPLLLCTYIRFLFAHIKKLCL